MLSSLPCSRHGRYCKQRTRSKEWNRYPAVRAKERHWDDVAVDMIDKYMGTGVKGKPEKKPDEPPPLQQGAGNGVIFLILVNYLVFLAQKYSSVGFLASLPLVVGKWQWWQLLSYAFCHADFNHLASNMFLLLTFGRLVEEDEGAFGLICTYIICAIGAAAAFLATAPSRAAIVGASGSVFGLLVVSIAAKLAQFNFRKIVELFVICPFVYSQIMANVNAQVAGVGGNISYIAHIGGAVTGLVLVLVLSLLPSEK